MKVISGIWCGEKGCLRDCRWNWYFFGEPFDRDAVIHTLRHLAMRVGWTLRPRAERRIIYATTDNPVEIPAWESDVIILSSLPSRRHMTESRAGIPLRAGDEGRLPFYHPKGDGIIDGDGLKEMSLQELMPFFNLHF